MRYNLGVVKNSENLGEFIIENTRRHGLRPAFIIKKTGVRTPLSFDDFNKKVLDISRFLKSKYGGSGFKVGLWGENRTEWCALAIGIWHSGGTLVPLMHIATEAEVKKIISAAALDCLFVSSNILDSWQADPKTFEVGDVYIMDFAQTSYDGVQTLGSLLGTSPGQIGQTNQQGAPEFTKPIEPTKSDDTAVLIFTSGTTGHPKGVMLTHQNLITNIQDTMSVVPGDEKDRVISVLPLSHMFELIAGFAIVHVKGMCISYPESLKPDEVLAEMRAHRATMMAAVPLMFEIMDRTIQEKIKQLPLTVQSVLKKSGALVRKFPFLGKIIFKKVHQIFGGHIRFFFTGGAKIDSEIILRFKSLGIQMLQGYGLTETSPIISFTSVESKKYSSVGKPVHSLQVKIDNPSSEGEGEICVKGASVFKGYFENEEATAEAFKDGWFHTGDLGHLDEDSYIYITGRKKDLIVTPNGKNVYPEELEEILKNSSLFAEVSVLGIDSGRGESVHAVIVPSNTARGANSKELIWQEINRLTENISDYKKIQGLTITTEDLPKTPTKKVKKHILREFIKSGKSDSGSFGPNSSEPRTNLNSESNKQKWLVEKLSQITKKPEIWLEADLKQDLGIDSLTFMEVISQIESKWDNHIPDEEFSQIILVKDLVQKLEPGLPGALPISPSETPSGPPLVSPTVSPSTSPTVLPPNSINQPGGFDFRHNNSVFMNTLRVLVHALVIRPCLKLMFRFKVIGGEIVRENGNLVITPNHTSHFDLLSVLSGIPVIRLNRTYAVAAEDYFFNTKIKAFLVRLLFNAIPFDRKVRVEKGFRICEGILKEGGSLVIFPEGTRSPDGKPSRFKPGVGRLLASQPYKAVPCFIAGAFEAFPKGAVLPRMGKITVTFGNPQIFRAVKSDINGYQQIAGSLQHSMEEIRDVKIKS